MLCRRLLALFYILSRCTGFRRVKDILSFQNHLLNAATFPNLSVLKVKIFRTHPELAGSPWDVPSWQHSPALQPRGAGCCKGSAWSGAQRCAVFPRLLSSAHKPECLGTCLLPNWAASLCLASWLAGHLAQAAHGTEFNSAVQLSVRGPGPCWQNCFPCSVYEDGLVQVELQVFKPKNKLEM